MEHTRLRELPKGQKWKAVVAAMARRDDSPDDLPADARLEGLPSFGNWRRQSNAHEETRKWSSSV